MIDKNINPGFTITQPISIWNKAIKLSFKDLFTRLGKMAISGAASDWKNFSENAIDLLKEAKLQEKPEQLAWVLIYQSLVRTFSDL